MIRPSSIAAIIAMELVTNAAPSATILPFVAPPPKVAAGIAGHFPNLPPIVYGKVSAKKPAVFARHAKKTPALGEEFGCLVPIARDTFTRKLGTTYLCLCDPRLNGCGKTKIVSLAHLRDGSTKSCGCKGHRKAVAT